MFWIDPDTVRRTHESSGCCAFTATAVTDIRRAHPNFGRKGGKAQPVRCSNGSKMISLGLIDRLCANKPNSFMQATRRRFIKAAVGGAAGMTFSRVLPVAAAQAMTIPIGFQLWTVRGEFARNVPDTLKTLSQIGYKAVEFWGYAGTPNVYQNYSGSELRKVLDDCGLKCCGIHIDLKALAKDSLQRTIENNQALGSEYLNVAAAKEKMGSEDRIAELAALLNQTAGECHSHKMIVGYHAHPFDFEKINGRFAWDLLFSRTQPEVNMQMDVEIGRAHV